MSPINRSGRAAEPAVGSRGLVLAVALAASCLVYLMDVFIPLGVAIGVIHVVILLVVFWRSTKAADLFLLAGLATLFIALGYSSSPADGVPARLAIANRLLAILLIWATAAMLAMVLAERRRIRTRSRKMIDSLQRFVTLAAKDLDKHDKGIMRLAEKFGSLRSSSQEETALLKAITGLVEKNQQLERAISRTKVELREELERIGKQLQTPAPGSAVAPSRVEGSSPSSPATAGGGPPEDEKSTRPRLDRRPYEREQPIAPCDGEKFPEPETFIDVQCSDISTKGFSFLVPEPPDFDVLVVGLGCAPEFMYVTAEVDCVRPEGGDHYRVECHFIGRLEGASDFIEYPSVSVS